MRPEHDRSGESVVRAVCARCNNYAEGFAVINDERYCHGESISASCYERTLWDQAHDENQRWLNGTR